MADNDFLASTHPLYDARKLEWEANERRLRGGWHVLNELQRFDWETSPRAGELGLLPGEINPRPNRDDVPGGYDAHARSGAHFVARRSRAVYLNFPDMFSTLLIGHVFRKSPIVDQGLSFGTLGEVTRPSTTSKPSRAELVYYNVDGVGNDGSQWTTWWTKVSKWASATGHRWVAVDAPAVKPVSLADEIAGRRPYLVHYSPLMVTNWHYEDGVLQFAIVKFPYRRPRMENGKLVDNQVQYGYRLMVRKGFDGFGGSYTGGGWWEFDTKNKLLPGRQGTWDATNGDIPMWPHFYERDEEMFSRSGLSELGNAAVAWMNLESAASFDAWDAATSLQFLLGVNAAAFNLAMDKIVDGSRYVPIPLDPEVKVSPQVHDGSTGAVTSQVFDERMNQIRLSVREIAGMEASGRPESSGESKRMGFAESKSPRLSLLASEIEGSQNTALHFLEQRFGNMTPTGAVTWPRDFEIVPIMDRIERVFDLEALSGYKSRTVGTKAMVAAVIEAGLVTDDDERKKIEGEYDTAAKERQDETTQLRTLQREVTRTRAGVPDSGTSE